MIKIKQVYLLFIITCFYSCESKEVTVLNEKNNKIIDTVIVKDTKN